MEYNTTPVANMQLTPTQLFFGRLIKTKLPIADNLLFRNSMSEAIVQEKIYKKKQRQKYYYDKSAKS